MDPATYNRIVGMLPALGYDAERLQPTLQPQD
jgi:hypothetical protein